MIFYLAWVVLALGAIVAGDLRRAVWFILFAGWLFLPPGDHGFAGREGLFPYWILGGALPSDVWVDKAWLAPTLALALTCWQVPARWQRLIPHWTDAAMAAFCLWPLAQSAILDTPFAPAAATTAYLSASWGACWLIGRLFLQSAQDAESFARSYAGLTVLLLPVAILEGVTPVRIHSLLLGMHPLAFDGIQRYLGYRPQALFEHGNQYGIWCAGAVVASFWVWGRARSMPDSARTQRIERQWRACTIVLGLMLLAAQSVGAILLGGAGLVIMAKPGGLRFARKAIPALLLLALLALALHLSGVFPVRRMITTTPLGPVLLDAIRATGRGSFAWRISQDLKTLPMLKEHLVFGTGQWNWFAPVRTRPWGLPLLLIGQYGLIGCACCAAALGGALLRQVRGLTQRTDLQALTAVVICLFLGDAALNSFLLFPALVAAGVSVTVRPSAKDGIPGHG